MLRLLLILFLFGVEAGFGWSRQSLTPPVSGLAGEVAGKVEARVVRPIVAPLTGRVRQIFFTNDQFVQAGAPLFKLDADVHLPSHQLARAYVVAPCKGIITGSQVRTGDLVRRGATVASLHDLTQMRVLVAVSASQAAGLHLSDKVTARFAELVDRTFVGTVEYVAPPSESQDAFVVKILVSNAVAPLIKPGMHTFVSFNTL